jgi:hypothetical protein
MSISYHFHRSQNTVVLILLPLNHLKMQKSFLSLQAIEKEMASMEALVCQV